MIVGALWEPASSQNYYLVVGAFATENEGITEFTSYLPGNGRDTAYTLNENSNVLHLYVLKTTDAEEVISKTMALQRELGSNPNPIATSTEYKLTSPLVLPGETASATEEASGAGASSAGPAGLAALGGVPPKPMGQYFKFTIEGPDGKARDGQLHHVDFKEGVELATFKSDTYIDILPPVESSKMPVVFGVFGYKEVEKYIDYNDPSATYGAYRDEHGAWVIPYTLERLEEGDVSVMYNVSFNDNAVMMRPESQRDLDELVKMMKWNPAYVIRIHAHCNGRGKRDITLPGAPFQWFENANTNTIVASPKELTRFRGALVRKYLLEHGIEDDRIRTYAWGSSDMLVDSHGPYAYLNDRIEIEILED